MGQEPRSSEIGLERLKRRSYAIALVVAAIAAFFGYFLDTTLVAYPALRVVFGPMTTLGALVVALLISSERVRLERIERYAYLASGTILVVRIMVAFVVLPEVDSVLSVPSFSPWISAVYIMAFVAFPTRKAVASASALYAVLLTMCAGFVTYRGIGSLSLHERGVLMQELVIAPPFVISLLYFMAITKEALARERAERALLDRIAHTDELTGIANRRHVLGAAQKELERIEREPRPFSVLMLDIDHFKRINDTYGHAMGDEVLRMVARTLEEVVRAGDDVGRFGGEEFLVLAYGANEEMAERAAERIRGALAGAMHASLPRISASVGIAAYRRGESLASLLARADTALYDAKHEGRNRVCIAV